MKIEDEVLVSEHTDNILQIIGYTLAISFIFLIYTQMIVYATWIGCIITLIILFFVATHDVQESIRNKYYFSQKNIVVADHKNEYIGEIDFDNTEVFWNESFEESKYGNKYFLIIKSEKNMITIKQKHYKNYHEIKNFLNQSGLKQNDSLKDAFYKDVDEFYSKLQLRSYSFSLITTFILLCSFGFIVSDKKDTGAKMYFIGKIDNIAIYRKGRSSTQYIELRTYPSLRFNINNDDVDFFKRYNYYNGREINVNLNKKIKIGISKDTYDWKTKNDLIEFLDFSDGKSWSIEEYQMLEE